MEQPVLLTGSRFDAAAMAPASYFQARVEHAYRLAAYVSPTDGGDLVVLAIDAAGGQPNGISVPGTIDFRTSCPIGARVSVDLSLARPWSSRLPARSRGIGAGALRRAREAAAARAPKDGFGPLLTGGVSGDGFARAAQPRIRAIQRALVEGSAPNAMQAAAELVGLGIGLTPSGDDLLIGLLAGLEIADDPLRSAIARAVAANAAERTSAISARVLLQAASGRYAQRLHDVVAAIDTRDNALVDVSVDAAMRHGATSGADTLLGLFIGLRQARAGEAREVTTA